MKWFNAKNKPTAVASPHITNIAYSDAGVTLDIAENVSDSSMATRSRAIQLVDLGFGELVGDQVRMSWTDIYDISEDEDLRRSASILGLPPVNNWRIALESRGALTDSDFVIRIRSWIDPVGQAIDSAPARQGASLTQTGNTSLMPRTLWDTIQTIQSFAGIPENKRTSDSNRKSWAAIRRTAIKAKCELDHFLHSTTVLDVNSLAIGLRRSGSGAGKVTEIVPSFDEAPDDWLLEFDRAAAVRGRYDILTEKGIVQVIVAPDVQTVLRELKKMPGRRVSGPRAEAFERNPIAALGLAAETVIDPVQFEQARIDAGLGITEFRAIIRRDREGKPQKFALQIETICGDDVTVDETTFSDAAEVRRFVKIFRNKEIKKFQCVAWHGFDLEILESTAREVKRLEAALHELDLVNAGDHSRQLLDATALAVKPSMADLESILAGASGDISKFSDRIQGFGIEPTYSSPFLAKKDDNDGWFPDNIHVGLAMNAHTTQSAKNIVLDDAEKQELAESLKTALLNGADEVQLPGHDECVPVIEAVAALNSFDVVKNAGEGLNAEVESQVKRGTVKPLAAARQKVGLLLRANIDQIDFIRNRGSLSDSIAEVVIPKALLPHVKLHQHQIDGIAWLQNLWNRSPHDCSGALLADDMGLGKTLQLLTFVQSILEADQNADPFLIVAPVSLLINWEQEAARFFGKGTILILRLHGEEVKAKRKSTAELEVEFVSDERVDLLKAGWLGNARIVFTTYDTLRNLEYSLASQRWSAVICDEAQKIKYPGTMATRSAKKQNARFYIACTGTPVENTLVDLWSLFDFVQPGLLKSLKEFGNTYRSPIEAKTDAQREKTEELRRLIEPQTLRRMKQDINISLPAKLHDQACRKLLLNQEQRVAYEAALIPIHDAKKAEEKRPGLHFSVLHQLKKICSDPTAPGRDSTAGDSVDQIEERSPKMTFLVRQLMKIKELDEKAIVFCEFLDLQSTLQRVIHWRFGLKPDIINGSTTTSEASVNNRQRRIDVFQKSEGFNVLILSPVAVGFGVNIQAANHVIHFTRTWNPAKEDQATDRAYRIGQTRDVHVYCPVVTSPDFKTFDAKLDELLERKRQLSTDMLNGTGDITEAELSEFL